MNNMQKRFLLFLVFCIGIRSVFVYIAKTVDKKYLPIMGYIALIPAIGFTYIYLTDGRKSGVEVFGERIWWNNLRPLHGLLYFVFAYMAISKIESAWIVLLIDVVIGLISFLTHHYMVGDLSL